MTKEIKKEEIKVGDRFKAIRTLQGEIPEQSMEIRENDYFKNEALKLKCFKEPELIQEKIFDRPKSKFHK